MMIISSYLKEMPLYVVPTSKAIISWRERPLYGLRETGMAIPESPAVGTQQLYLYMPIGAADHVSLGIVKRG